MSLLLDAMKKSSDSSKSTGLSNLSLEEHPAEKQRGVAETETRTASSRAAGENLFAAKKKKEAPRRRWKLGLVPTTFLICSVLGAGYGYYVWRELNPPAPPRITQRPATPPPTPITTPAPPPLVATLTPPVAPVPPASSAAAPAEPAPPKAEAAPQKTAVAAHPASKPFSRPRTSKPADLHIERAQEADTLSTTLLDAYQAYQRGDYVSAEQGYRNVLGKDAHNRDALLGLGAIAQRQGQDETAQYYFRQVLLLDPRDPVAAGALSAYDMSGDDTESQLKQMLADQPRSGALNYALGNLYAGQSRWAEAQQAYFNARSAEPANAQFTYNLAISLDHLGQGKQALPYYQQALQLDPSGTAGFDHAQAQQRLNELSAAGR